MIVHTPKTMTILSSVLVLIGFFGTSCVGINLGDIPRGLPHPRDVPSVDPSTLGQKPYTPSPPSSIVTILYKLQPASNSHWDVHEWMRGMLGVYRGWMAYTLRV